MRHQLNAAANTTQSKQVNAMGVRVCLDRQPRSLNLKKKEKKEEEKVVWAKDRRREERERERDHVDAVGCSLFHDSTIPLTLLIMLTGWE